jgi:N-acyl homoserine lactone hydrolase
MKKLWKWTARAMLGGIALALAGIVVLLVRNRPLASAANHTFVRPTYDVLPKTGLCWVEFDHGLAPAQAATAGITHAQRWELTGSALLIRHPHGTLLVDTGSSTHFQQEIADYPFWRHLEFEVLTGGKSAARTASAVLNEAGIRPETLIGVILSHAHMDHAGGWSTCLDCR